VTPEEVWSAYAARQGPDFEPTPRSDGRLYEAEHWGSPGAMADELAALIVAGIKTASCSCLWEWEAANDGAGEPLIPVGFHSVVLDGSGEAVGVVRYTSIEVRRYCDVDEAFAHAEGEGDRTLAYWRRAHWRWFGEVLPKIGRAPSEEMPLVCERFELVYAP